MSQRKNISWSSSRAMPLGALLLAAAVLVPGSSALAHWWNDSSSSVKVTIAKYIDGSPATSESADELSFPMSASWNDPDGIGEGSGAYALSKDGATPYQTKTVAFKPGASYSTSETLGGAVVAANCDGDQPFALTGYTTGSTKAEAASGTPALSAPSFENLTENHYVIVWNTLCEDDEPGSEDPSGDISGQVTGGASDEEDGELAVTSIDAQKTTAVANGSFTDGWKYVFHITVPSDEPNLAMKFADWTSTSGSHTIPAANNLRISSAQADNSGATVLITGANVYSSPALHMEGDMDSGTPGLQVEVLVEAAVPAGSYNGTYSTAYGVQTLP